MTTYLPYQYIYALVDPRNNETRYIGRTRYPNARIEQHLHNPVKACKAWVRELRDLGMAPRMELLKRVDPFKASDIERNTIAKYRKAGATLLNLPGGRYPFRQRIVLGVDKKPFRG